MDQRRAKEAPALELRPGERERFEEAAKAARSRYTGVHEWDLPQLNLDAENASWARPDGLAGKWGPS